MYIRKSRIVTLLAVLLTALFAAQPLLAANDLPDLINKAGMQRMLSQRIAKAYFYQGKDIQTQNARLQLESSRILFQKNHSALMANVQDSEIRTLLSFVDSTFSQFNALVAEPYNKGNAGQILDMSDALLETSHQVVMKLEGLSSSKTDSIINISGKQRMLAQRISKYYIAYQAGFHDDNTVRQLKNAVDEFDSALNTLVNEGRNTEQINKVLVKMQTKWKKIAPFFLEVEKGGLPIMVFTTTDEITTLANEVTGLYVKVAPAN